MILTDGDIIEYARMGRPLVKPFNKKNLTPNGYDLSMEEVKVGIYTDKLDKDLIISIPVRTHFKILTQESVELPDDMTATLWLRSSYARKGILATFGYVDVGFHGKIVVNLYNASTQTLYINPFEKRTFCQIVFEKLDKMPLANYSKRSGNYQNQKSLKSIWNEGMEKGKAKDKNIS